MEPLIGVFSSGSEAEATVLELLNQNVPKAAVLCLTEIDHERTSSMKTMGRFIGAFVGFGTGFSMGVVASLALAHSEVSHLLLAGFGVASLMSLLCALLGGGLCRTAVSFQSRLKKIGIDRSNLDFNYLQGLLKEGKAVLLVNGDAVPGATKVISSCLRAYKSEAAKSVA